MHIAIVISTRHADPPRITAELAVLNEAAMDVRLDVDLHLLAAKRTRDHEFVWHCRLSYSYWAADAARHHDLTTGEHRLCKIRLGNSHQQRSPRSSNKGS